MRRTALPELFVALLVVLAGCSGFAGPNDGERTATVTPAPVPTTEPRERLAPGLTREDVTNVSALANAHDASLRGEPFTRWIDWTFRYENGTPYRTLEYTIRASDTRERFHYDSRRSGAVVGSDDSIAVRFEVWSDRRIALEATTFANGTRRYETVERQVAERLRRRVIEPNGRRIADLLAESDASVTDRYDWNGTRLYRIQGADPPVRTLPDGTALGPSRNATVVALVDSQGFVHGYETTYTTDSPDGTTLTATYVVQYDRIGSTRVDRPPWYEDALDETTANATAGTDVAAATGTYRRLSRARLHRT